MDFSEAEAVGENEEVHQRISVSNPTDPNSIKVTGFWQYVGLITKTMSFADDIYWLQVVGYDGTLM